MILFVVHDAGPAKYFAYIMRSMDTCEYLCIASDISSKVFDEFNIEYIQKDREINLKNINLIITGTCIGSGIDKDWVKIGKDNNIKTVSIIEHWSLYKKRFELDGGYDFPDIILVNDLLAKEEAIKDGIDENLIHIGGNPVFENIFKKEYSLSEIEDWKNELNISECKKIITFVSEEYKKDFSKSSLEYQGFDEFDVLDDIIGILDANDMLLIKLHPAEDITKYEYLNDNQNIIIIEKIDIDKLISFSDTFIGMGSMLLLEASLFRNSVYSYRPNETVKFIGNKNNMTIHIKNKEILKSLLQGKHKGKNKITKNNFIGSTKNIIKLMQEYHR